jgi:drug/metabolite transporter (DMT)-like permease
MRTNRFIQLNFACIYLIWGSTYLVIQTALDGIPPYTLIFLRLLLASSILFLIARIRSDQRPTRKQVFNSFFLSIFFFILCNATVVWTQQFVNSGIVALTASLSS